MDDKEPVERPVEKKNAYIYVDGFNLFYGCLKGEKNKWLNLDLLCRYYYPKYNILKIRYCTALIKERKSDKTSPINQQMYLRALKTLPNIDIILGSFKERLVRRPLVSTDEFGQRQKLKMEIFPKVNKKLPVADDSQWPRPQYALIRKTEEKGSDVNLAVNLVKDAYEDNFDVAVIISNDSDLAGSLRIVKNKLKKTVEILNPYDKTNKKLQKVSSNIKYIREKALEQNQFLDNLTDKVGDFHKPVEW